MALKGVSWDKMITVNAINELYALTPFISPVTLRDRSYYHPNFTTTKTEAQGSERICSIIS